LIEIGQIGERFYLRIDRNMKGETEIAKPVVCFRNAPKTISILYVKAWSFLGHYN